MFDPREKIAVLIDGANLYSASRALGFDIDYRRLLSDFRQKGYLVRAIYYTALAEDQEYSSLRPLIDWLDYNGYRVVTKPLREFTDAQGRRKVKGNMDIELAVDAMEMVEHVDHFVLFSGDGDFRHLVVALQRKGKKVTVASTLKTSPPMIADDLRRQADHFLELSTLAETLGRDPAQRPPRPQREVEEEDEDEYRGAVSDATPATEPPRDCPLCPRLKDFRDLWRAREPDWHNAPVATFGAADGRLLIIGLAPGLRGANRTGRPFTGDYAGDLLYATLLKYGFAKGVYRADPADGLTLVDAAIANAVRCVPPENKPLPVEMNTCRQFLTATLAARPHVKALVALGRIAHDSTLRAMNLKLSSFPLCAWRGARNRRGSALRQLSLLPLQHEHGSADDGDV